MDHLLSRERSIFKASALKSTVDTSSSEFRRDGIYAVLTSRRCNHRVEEIQVFGHTQKAPPRSEIPSLSRDRLYMAGFGSSFGIIFDSYLKI